MAVEQIPGGYKVKDANGQSLAYVYGRALMPIRPMCSPWTRLDVLPATLPNCRIIWPLISTIQASKKAYERAASKA
jgi:hypothetical protein